MSNSSAHAASSHPSGDDGEKKRTGDEKATASSSSSSSATPNGAFSKKYPTIATHFPDLANQLDWLEDITISTEHFNAGDPNDILHLAQLFRLASQFTRPGSSTPLPAASQPGPHTETPSLQQTILNNLAAPYARVKAFCTRTGIPFDEGDGEVEARIKALAWAAGVLGQVLGVKLEVGGGRK